MRVCDNGEFILLVATRKMTGFGSGPRTDPPGRAFTQERGMGFIGERECCSSVDILKGARPPVLFPLA